MATHHSRALQLVQQGDWDASHREIQNHDDELACLIHAYLHRVEGDLGNARYWYRRAGGKLPDDTPERELARLQRRCAQEGADRES